MTMNWWYAWYSDWSCHLSHAAALNMLSIPTQSTDESRIVLQVTLFIIGEQQRYCCIQLGIPFVLLKTSVEKTFYPYKEQNRNALGNGDISVTPLWTMTARLTDSQPELKSCSGAECCIVDHRWRGWMPIWQNRLLLTSRCCLKVWFEAWCSSTVQLPCACHRCEENICCCALLQ